MARFAFGKWQGTGNDFILMDDRTGAFPSGDTGLVRKLCDRHFGIGSDGLILVRAPGAAGTDYHMEFYNPDGSRSFCGNGSRCAFAFWRSLMGDDWRSVTGRHLKARFTAIDGSHEAEVRDVAEVAITLHPPGAVEGLAAGVDLVDTGSPHLLVWVEDPEVIDIISEAHEHRYSDRFRKDGVNVNFVRWNERSSLLEMRTYERGVEAETLSCGTGVTAAALDAIHRKVVNGRAVEVSTRGGRLRVEVQQGSKGAGKPHVTLIGPVAEVFTGLIDH